MTTANDKKLELSIETLFACCTPTESVASETMAQPAFAQVEYPPRAGKTFVIRSHDERRLVLELLDNKLRVASEDEAGLGIAWHCTKKNGWYTFVNTVSGRLGYDANLEFGGWGSQPQKLGGRDNETQSWEYFTIDRHENGGYVLLVVIHGVLHQMGIAKDSRDLVALKEGGTAWDFIEAKITGISYLLEKKAL